MNKLTKLLIDILDQKVAERKKASSDREVYVLDGYISALIFVLMQLIKEDSA